MCIAKATYLEKPERLIIWNGLSNCFTFFLKKILGTHAFNNGNEGMQGAHGPPELENHNNIPPPHPTPMHMIYKMTMEHDKYYC